MLGKRGRDAVEGDGSGDGSKEKSEESNSSKRIKVEEEGGSRLEEKQDSVTGKWREIAFYEGAGDPCSLNSGPN